MPTKSYKPGQIVTLLRAYLYCLYRLALEGSRNAVKQWGLFE